MAALQTQRATALPTGPDASSKHLEDQAAAAALYVKRQDEAAQPRAGQEYLDSNYKLSAAGESTRSRKPWAIPNS